MRSDYGAYGTGTAPVADAPAEPVGDPGRTDLEPLYGSIEAMRFRDRMVITCAPTVALISPEVLFHDRSVGVRVHGSLIELADQATYRITGWDREHQSLIVLLEGDHREGS